MRKRETLKQSQIRIVVLILASISAPAAAQTFTSLFSFNGTDGAYPYTAMLQASDGNLYGTTISGGAADNGTVFKATPGGLNTFATVANPNPLIQATDGNFYGTTSLGGSIGGGTVFKLSLSGELTTIYDFCTLSGCVDGFGPAAAMVEGIDGNFYGTTEQGGTYGLGSVFRITPAGQLTALYSFGERANDGTYPVTPLVLGTDGNFYGTTSRDLVNNSGTVFKVTPAGVLTTLYTFCSQPNCVDGIAPYALARGADGNFYGPTFYGGTNNDALCLVGCGTIFEVSPEGKLKTIYNLCTQSGCSDGANPQAALVLGTDGNFYGTTNFGGNKSCNGVTCGTIFKITTGGALTTLHRFAGPDGGGPFQMVQDTSGTFYGTTYDGGTSTKCGIGCGTIFGLSTGLGPFVRTLPAAGKVGSQVGILGTDLTRATNVTFNGTTAQFSVKSPTLILTRVPASATTGVVQVTLPSQTLSGNIPFYVVP